MCISYDSIPCKAVNVYVQFWILVFSIFILRHICNSGSILALRSHSFLFTECTLNTSWRGLVECWKNQRSFHSSFMLLVSVCAVDHFPPDSFCLSLALSCSLVFCWVLNIAFAWWLLLVNKLSKKKKYQVVCQTGLPQWDARDLAGKPRILHSVGGGNSVSGSRCQKRAAYRMKFF